MRTLTPLSLWLRAAALCCIFSALAWAAPIGLIYSGSQWKHKKQGDALADCRAAIEENGGTVVELHPGLDEKALKAALAKTRGILVPGGKDVNPDFYGEKPDANLEATDRTLDELEFKVIAFAREQKLPMLGICRGLQIINVATGGSLHQDLPSQLKPSHRVIHRSDEVGAQDDPTHRVRLAENSQMRRIFGVETLVTNSYHHQGIKQLGKGLVASGWTEDGLVEAFESKDTTFLVGVQFHPEMSRQSNPTFNRIFVEFLKQAEKTSPVSSGGTARSR